MDMQAGTTATELEIAAFMGPHIKRARIALFFAGALYLLWGALNWSDVADVRTLVNVQPDGTVPPNIAHLIDVAYLLVVVAVGAGMADMLLAIAAGHRTMLAFNLAATVFVVHTGVDIYATGPLILTSWVFWLLAIVLVMGYAAARSAEQLRKSRR